MAVDKHVFFKDVAKRLAASTLLYKVDSVVIDDGNSQMDFRKSNGRFL